MSITSYNSGRVAWVATLEKRVLYDSNDIIKYLDLNYSIGDDFVDFLEKYYPETFVGRSGQVLYYRLPGGGYDVDLDLYEGNQDIFYYWDCYVYENDPELVEDPPKIIVYSKNRPETGAELNDFYDPV